MDMKLLSNIIVGLCIFTLFSGSLAANSTDTIELYLNLTEKSQTEIFTVFSTTEVSPSVAITNAVTEFPIVATERSKRKRLLKERPRRQGFEYGYSPARYGVASLFDMCPQVPSSCPICSADEIQAPSDICNFVVLKVLAISSPQTDSEGRVCGKFGLLKLYGDFDEKEFRRLIRFSLSVTCACNVKASATYILMSPLSAFFKSGLLFNQVELSENVIIMSYDRLIERDILEVLNRCTLFPSNSDGSETYNVPVQDYVVVPEELSETYVSPTLQPSNPYIPPSTTASYESPPTESYVPPPTATYVAPLTTPYVPPPTTVLSSVPSVPVPTASYVPPAKPPVVSPKPPVVYNPPAQLPVETSYTIRPMPQIPVPGSYTGNIPPNLNLNQLQPPFYRGTIPYLYPTLTSCPTLDTCPSCYRLENAEDITEQYCNAGFTFLAVIRVPDASSIKYADAAYSGPTCMHLRTNIVYDITRTRDPQIVVNSLIALLPTKCATCFEGLSGPVIVMIMGQVPPVPPAAQLDGNFQVYITPVPSTIVLPSCTSYSVYGGPVVAYSLALDAPLPYAASTDCPEASDQTCPVCQNYKEDTFAEACANGFAIVAELHLAGPYFTSQRLPAISVKTTTTNYLKSVEISITNPPPIECIKGFFKIIQNIGLAPFYFPGEMIPFVSLPNCACLSQGYSRLLIFSTWPLNLSPEGVLLLSQNIHIAFLQPQAAIPVCGRSPAYIPPPSPPTYFPPQPLPDAYLSPQLSPFHIPASHIALPRPVRVPVTYIPPPPPPPSYEPRTVPHPVFIHPPHYIPSPVKEPSPAPSLSNIPSQPAFNDSSLPLPPTTVQHLYETHSPAYATGLPNLEETPPPVIGCIEHGTNSCVKVETNEHQEIPFAVNVDDEDLPFLPQFAAFNSHFYEDASVWSPSFNACLPSVELSCPLDLEDSSEKFEEFYCNSTNAFIIAVGVDYSNMWDDAAVTKKLSFIQPETPYIGMEYYPNDNPTSLKVAVTRNKTMERKIQLQDNADYCYMEKVLVLNDISKGSKPRSIFGVLDVYIPGFCNSEIFDKTPVYGILLSATQPSHMKNPTQLTDEFAFFPLRPGRLALPVCGKLPEDEASSAVQREKFWVPAIPLENRICENPEELLCQKWDSMQGEYYTLPCGVKSAVIVLIQNTSAGNSIGPNLEILENVYESGAKEIILNVKSNVYEEDDQYMEANVYEEDSRPFLHNQYMEVSTRCKYVIVKVLKDLSRSPLLQEDDLLTVIGNMNCDNPFFELTNEVVLLLSDMLIPSNTVVPFSSLGTEIIGIPPGTTVISFCNTDQSADGYDATSSDKVTQLHDNLFNSSNYDNLEDRILIDTGHIQETTSETHEESGNFVSHQLVENSCKGHADTCPVCEDIGSISSEIYCNSELSLFAQVIEQEPEDGNCSSGIIASLYDITVRNPIPESKVLKISYTIPSHCSCPVLKEESHLMLLFDKYVPDTEDLSINLSNGTYLYSTPLKTSLPSCHFEDAIQPRSKDMTNVVELDSAGETLLKKMPELFDPGCPTIDHTCPICKSMDEEELKDIYCSSEEVLLVSKSKTPKEDARKLPRIGKATFTQHLIADNYSLEINIEKYESGCSFSLAEGNCSDSLERYYYNGEEERCLDFVYTGCGGNSNNFISKEHCEEKCLVEDLCKEGSLEIKHVLRSSVNSDLKGKKFVYALPQHCSCPQLLQGDKKGYLMSTKPEDLWEGHVQLSSNYYFVPFPKNKRKSISCKKSENSTDGNLHKKGDKSTELQTAAPSGFLKKVFG